MSKKKKNARFAENRTFPNLFEISYHEMQQQPFNLRGKWNSDVFLNNNPIILELGCGKGDYTTGLAIRNPDKNYIGMDIKGARLWFGCKKSQTERILNVAFIRSKIQSISYFFARDEVDEIWITFPDPQPRSSREKKRLTSLPFLERYKTIAKNGASIHLKTDDDDLYLYTLSLIENSDHKIIFATNDLYNSGYTHEAAQIQTFYEKIWLTKGLTIKYLQFELNQ